MARFNEFSTGTPPKTGNWGHMRQPAARTLTSAEKEFVNELSAVRAGAKHVLEMAARQGAIAETAIKDGWELRAMVLTPEEKSTLAAKPKTIGNRTIDLALRVAGSVTIAEMATRQATQAGHGRPVLEDTPEARAAALEEFGIDI